MMSRQDSFENIDEDIIVPTNADMVDAELTNDLDVAESKSKGKNVPDTGPCTFSTTGNNLTCLDE